MLNLSFSRKQVSGHNQPNQERHGTQLGNVYFRTGKSLITVNINSYQGGVFNKKRSDIYPSKMSELPVDDWKDQVRQKLIEVFDSKNQTEDLVRILYYLDEEDKAYAGSPEVAPAWRTLRSALISENTFKNYSKMLAEDTKRAEKDESFRLTMNTIYSQIMEASDQELPENADQHLSLEKFANLNMSAKCGFLGMAKAWSLMTPAGRQQVIEVLPKIISNRQLLRMVDDVTSLVDRVGGNIVMIGLAAITLSYDIIISLKRWWKGEISGVRCCKIIVDSAASIAAGVAGGTAGAMLGSLAGPFGTFAGGIIGGFVCSKGMEVMSDRFTQWLFGIPQSEALENAYKYFEVKKNASNNEINSAFRKMCLKHHPDKGGSHEDFLMVQLNMGVIKMAREDL